MISVSSWSISVTWSSFESVTVQLSRYVPRLILLDNKGIGASWFLDKIIVTNETTKKKYFFLCGRWLAKVRRPWASRDLMCTRMRKMDLSRENYQLVAKMVSRACLWLITVSQQLLVTFPAKNSILTLTGNRRGAGTDADVFVTIFGEVVKFP